MYHSCALEVPRSGSLSSNVRLFSLHVVYPHGQSPIPSLDSRQSQFWDHASTSLYTLKAC
jgi:hypothetical protein